MRIIYTHFWYCVSLRVCYPNSEFRNATNSKGEIDNGNSVAKFNSPKKVSHFNYVQSVVFNFVLFQLCWFDGFVFEFST